MFGLVQAAFTAGTLLLFAGVVYRSFALQLLWQAVKFLVPLYHGSQYQCEKLPRYQFLEGLERLQQLEAGARQQEARAAAPAAAAPAAVRASSVPGRPARSRSARRQG
jgi:hypothetical protein